jgi:phage major head subunit gpT-like protein
MNTAFIPSPLDEATRLEGTAATATAADVPITKTATFAGTAFNLGSLAANAGIGQPMAAVIKTTAIDHTTGDETYSAQLMDSVDGSTWLAIGPPVTISPTVLGKASIPGFRTQQYVALALTLGGTTPSITYDAWLTTQGFPRN